MILNIHIRDALLMSLSAFLKIATNIGIVNFSVSYLSLLHNTVNYFNTLFIDRRNKLATATRCSYNDTTLSILL